MHAGIRVWVAGHNLAAKREIDRYLSGAVRPPSGPVDVAIIVPESDDEAVYFATKIERRLAAGGSVYVVVPDVPACGPDDHTDRISGLLSQLRTAGFQTGEEVRLSPSHVTIRLVPRTDS